MNEGWRSLVFQAIIGWDVAGTVTAVGAGVTDRKVGDRVTACVLFCESLLTTSGHFHATTLASAIDIVGPDRVLFSVDYPYEQMDVGGRWFDDLALDARLKARIGRENASALFRLALPKNPLAASLGFAS